MVVPLRYIGDPVLRKKCKPVEKITDEILQIADKLIVTMKAHNGSGLAAPQIGYEWRMFAIWVSDEVDEKGFPYDAEPKVFINPEITYASKKQIMMNEGCLSIPGLYEGVNRPERIDIKAIDVNGKTFEEKELHRWRGRCFQHELDHLNGILFIDHFPEDVKREHESALKLIEHQCRMKNVPPGFFK